MGHAQQRVRNKAELQRVFMVNGEVRNEDPEVGTGGYKAR